MSHTIGQFSLVLHSHVPYVLHHGTWPHGEDWLYEAAAETYMPLLAMIDEVLFLKARPTFTLGLTPVLLEQLVHPRFRNGFKAFLKDNVVRAERDQKEFKEKEELHYEYLAGRWAEYYTEMLNKFDKINEDIPAAFGKFAQEGHIEILTSLATHGFASLMLEDSCVRAQLRAGLATSEKILGIRPTGMWLPECAYRPGGTWYPAISWGGPRERMSLEQIMADEGISHFFVEDPFVPPGDEEARKHATFDSLPEDRKRFIHEAGNWRPTSGPMGVGNPGQEPKVAAFARCTSVCEQVWSGWMGYPGTGVYLEFHKKYGGRRGLRYWKVTNREAGLGNKDPYYPDDIAGVIHQQSQHFAQLIKGTLHDQRNNTGHNGAVTAAFDSELFGHWWFEGVQFLRDTLLTLHHDSEVEVVTAEQQLKSNPPDRCLPLPNFSWGEGTDSRVWINGYTHWMWEVLYRAEAKFGKLSFHSDWEKNPKLKELLEKAGRELLLLQASDWPFVVSRGQAIDYGIRRFAMHENRFDILTNAIERILEGNELDDLDKHQIADADLHDSIFNHIDLKWWNM